jgi:hypothetical protein
VLFDPCVALPEKPKPGISIPAVKKGMKKRLTATLIKCKKTTDHKLYWADGLHGFKKIQTANINRK